jgi:hypothetical protein
MVRPPSWKLTVPVLVPAAGGIAVTVAVKVTLCPDSDGLTEDATVVVVPPMFTFWVRGAEVLALKLTSPL